MLIPWIRSVLHMAWIGLTVVPWAIALLLISLVAPCNTVRRTAVNWFRVVLWGTRVILGIRMRVIGLEHLPTHSTNPAARVVLLSKHQSALETLWLPTLMPRPLAFVFKRELLKIPFFGWSMARMDMIYIDRQARASAMKHVLEQGQRLLSGDTWVVMFPEGTRIPRGEQGTYQTAGTRLAVHAGAVVVPIAVATACCWPKHGFVKTAGIVTVSIGKPMDSTGRDPKTLMRDVEAWIEAEMRRIDPGAYPAKNP